MVTPTQHRQLFEPDKKHYQIKIFEWLTGGEAFEHQRITLEHLIECFERNRNIAAAFFQLEETDKGYPHWQIHLVLYEAINTKLVTWLKESFDIDHRVSTGCLYIKLARSPLMSKNYCQKVPSRIWGPFTWMDFCGLSHAPHQDNVLELLRPN